ncbi:hypothetical protein [Aeromonas phage AS-szw]|uniref:Uncharacterized protein n=1 Tax=Aeromonas phage AS-szw TaxID=2026114 RepID=A0A291LDN5_9CAUD|nr:hypothetical protein [Aeromonas phage AS-szw]
MFEIEVQPSRELCYHDFVDMFEGEVLSEPTLHKMNLVISEIEHKNICRTGHSYTKDYMVIDQDLFLMKRYFNEISSKLLNGYQ